MVYHALLFSTDEKASRSVGQILSELDFHVEPCAEPFVAVKQITNQHYDALVVDCDNEQNAALLFKSARNSNSNGNSLAVALVQGQGGIAKAFRIGANLVLTKPIHMEQSKGTLRTAKGLLRKAEAAKPAFAAANVPKADATGVSEQPFVPTVVSQTGFSVNPVVSAALELQEEKFPELAPEEAALLESMPQPITTQSPFATSGQPENTWSPGKTSPETVALQTLAGSAASAVAPAKVGADFTPEEMAQSPESPSIAREKSTVESRSAHQAPFTNSSVLEDDNPPEGEFAGGAGLPQRAGNTKNFWIAAVLVLAVGGALYYAWPQLEPLLTNIPIVQKYLAPQQTSRSAAVQTPVQAPQPAPSPQPQSATGTGAEAQPAAAPVAGQTASPQTDTTANASSLPSAGTNSPSVTTANPPSEADNPAQHPLHLAPDVAAALLVGRVEPAYPPSALQQHMEGPVELRANISKDGEPSNVKVLSGKPPLTTAAVAAVRQWKYKPYAVNGQATEFQTEITVNFKLP